MTDIVIERQKDPVDRVDTVLNVDHHHLDGGNVPIQMAAPATQDPTSERPETRHTARLVAAAISDQARRRRDTLSRTHKATMCMPRAMALVRLPVTELSPTRAL